MVRISGLASGMDIDELVSSMMQAARVPLDTLEQKKQYTEWQRDDYRDINKSLLELDTLIKDGVGMQKSFIKKTVSVSDANAISVKNVNSTIDFTGKVKVAKLATAATMVSDNEKEIAINKATDLLSKVYSDNDKEIRIETINKDGSLNTYTTTIEATDTLNSLLTRINANSGVTAFYDENKKQISFTAKNTGAVPADLKTKAGEAVTSEIGLSGTFFTAVLNMDKNNHIAEDADRGTKGVNAELTYNGLKIERSSNTFTINGAEITLKQVTGDKEVTFSSAPDVDAILDTVTQFVNKYNEIIANIKTKTEEEKYRAYQPLTTAQRKDLTEDEIKLWEAKAKSGTLKSDSVLKGLLTKMRSSLYTSVGKDSASAKSLSQMGITTTSNYLEGGKLTIDEEKLRAAISEDPNQIYNLFMASGDSTGEQGLARRLRSDLKSAMTTIQEKAGKASSVNNSFTIGKLLNSYSTKMDSWEDKLTALETRYYKQFTAMETAINKANSQSTSLSSYFS